MEKREIGFSHGASENPDKTWERQINGRPFIFTKAREREGIFLYSCKCRSEGKTTSAESATGFHSDRDLTPDEVEQLPQFAAFIAGNI